MSAHPPSASLPPTPPDPSPVPPGLQAPGFRRMPRWEALLLTVLVLLAVLGQLWWKQTSRRSALGGLEARQRGQAYEQALRTLDSLCTPRVRPGMEGTCRQQARLVLDFPECDARCKALARPLAGPAPSR